MGGGLLRPPMARRRAAKPAPSARFIVTRGMDRVFRGVHAGGLNVPAARFAYGLTRGQMASHSDLLPGGQRVLHSDLLPDGQKVSPADLLPSGKKVSLADHLSAGKKVSFDDLLAEGKALRGGPVGHRGA